MRKLLNTLFVLSEDAYLSLDGENLVVLKGDVCAARFPLHTLESVLCFSYKGASPALMGGCAERGVAMSFFTPRGKFLCGVQGKEQGNVLLRRQQYRVADDPPQADRVAVGFLLGKLWNSRQVLLRALRDHPQRIEEGAFGSAAKQIAALAAELQTGADRETMRGWEGAAAKQYFDLFDQMVLQNEAAFAFTGRTRRPPLDRINAALSFAYTLLAHDCAAALWATGLDPYVGYLHTDRPGRQSLALI